MTVRIDGDRMTCVHAGAIVGHAVKIWDGWKVQGQGLERIDASGYVWLDYNGAITALTLVKRRACGHGDNDPHIQAWEEEVTRAHEAKLSETRA